MSQILRNFTPSTTRPFKGRAKLVEDLGKLLAAAGSSSPIVAVVGVMGAGKTRLVAEYAEANLAQYRVVWKVRASSAATLAEDYAGLAAPQVPGDKSSLGQSAMIRSIKDQLRKIGRWLLVFDDASDPAMLVDYIPRPYDATGHVVIISRNPNWLDPSRVLPVPPLDPDSAEELLKECVGQGARRADVQALAKELGFLPGALEMVIQYMQATRMTVGDYLKQLRRQPSTVLSSGLLYGNMPRTLANTWKESVERLQRDAPAGTDLLTLCAFMGPRPVPLGHLRNGLQALPADVSMISQVDACNRGLAALQREGLASISEQDISLNRAHRTLVRSAMSEEDQKRWVGYAAQVLRAAYPEHPSGARMWADYDTLVPHTGAVLGQMSRLKLEDDTRADLLQRLGLYYLEKASLFRACGCLERARKFHCSSHPLPCNHVARDLVLLGDTSMALADWGTAEEYYRNARLIYQRYHGLYDMAVAAILTRQGALACARGHFGEARRLCESAEADDKHATERKPQSKNKAKADANDKPKFMAYFVGKLGPLWNTLLDRKARKGALGGLWRPKRPETENQPQHPDSTAILRALGTVLLEFDAPANPKGSAKAKFAKARRIDAMKLKADHPFEARDLIGMGRASEKEGDRADPLGHYAEALGHYREALRIDEAAFGSRHPWVAEDLRCIAQLRLSELKARTGLKRSSAYYRELASIKQDIDRALDIDKSVFTPPHDKHPSIARDQVVLGRVFLALGDTIKGESALNEAVVIAKAAYGEKHPWTTEITGEWSRLVSPGRSGKTL